jgi:hypothetical protein
MYVGINGIAHKVKKLYVGVDGVAREVKKGYFGVDGIARKFFSGQTDGNRIQIVVVQNSTTSYTLYIYEYDKDFNQLYKKSLSIGNYSVCATYNVNTDEIVLIHAGKQASSATVDYYDRSTLEKKRSSTVTKISSYGYYPSQLAYHPLLDCYILKNYRSGWRDGDNYTAIFNSSFSQLDLWGSDCVFPENPCSANAIFAKRSSKFYLWDGTKRIEGAGSDSNGGVGAGHPYDKIALFTTIFGSGGTRTWKCHETTDGFPQLGSYTLSYSDASPFYNPDKPDERWITPVIDWNSGQPGFMILNRNFTLSRYTEATTTSPYLVFNQMMPDFMAPLMSGGAVVGTKTLYVFDKDGNIVNTKTNALEYGIGYQGRPKEYSTDLIPTFEPLKLY